MLCPFITIGQSDSLVLLTKNFKFSDGIYLSFEEFKENKPSISWDSTFARLHTNPQNLTTLVDTIHLKTSDDQIGQIWGFSLGGIPYINQQEKNTAGLNKYLGIKVRGNICYFTKSETLKKSKVIKAYNPVTGIPFRESEVMTEKDIERKFMLSFNTGEVLDFTPSNFIEWIETDSQLVNTVMELPDEDRAEKLFKCLLIYDDRNPVYVPVHQ